MSAEAEGVRRRGEPWWGPENCTSRGRAFPWRRTFEATPRQGCLPANVGIRRGEEGCDRKHGESEVKDEGVVWRFVGFFQEFFWTVGKNTHNTGNVGKAVGTEALGIVCLFDRKFLSGWAFGRLILRVGRSQLQPDRCDCGVSVPVTCGRA